MPERFELLPRPNSSWNTGYRCLETGCTFTTGFWPDDGSAEERIHTHLSRRHPTDTTEEQNREDATP